MTKWFWNWAYSIAAKRVNNLECTTSSQQQCTPYPPQGIGAERWNSGTSSMTFSMTSAEGGWVLSRTSYDPVKDRQNTRLFLISDDSDVAAEVGQIVSMETLRG
jgi:hypothetical protein